MGEQGMKWQRQQRGDDQGPASGIIKTSERKRRKYGYIEPAKTYPEDEERKGRSRKKEYKRKERGVKEGTY